MWLFEESCAITFLSNLKYNLHQVDETLCKKSQTYTRNQVYLISAIRLAQYSSQQKATLWT